MKDFFSKLPKLPKLNLPFKHKQQGGKTQLNQTQLLALAGAFCFLLACVTYFLLPSGEDTAKKQEIPMTQVVVAKQDIPQRTVIKENMLKVVDMPQDAVPAGAMRSVSEAVDKPANVPIQQGDILTDKKVITDPKLAGFVGMIPPDCRAISVGISDITGIAGFAKPGDYVDVMIIRKGKGNVCGEILLQNVLLHGLNKTAASNGEMQKSGSDNKDKDAKDKDKKNGGGADANASKDAMATATLALTSEEALKLAVEAQTGTIYLVLRPVTPNDVFAIDTEYTTVDSDTAGKTNSAPPSPAPAASNPSASSSYSSSPAPSYTSSAPAAPAAPASVPAIQAPSVDDGIEVIRGVESKMEGGN